MKFKIKKLKELSGPKASVYTILQEGSDSSLFDNFIKENLANNQHDIFDIIKRVKLIGQEEGAKEGYFKHKEGKIGDLVCALYDAPNSNLRLYCIRFGNAAIILGGGGPKSKSIKAWQEDPALSQRANEMIKISKMIYQRILDKDIKWGSNQIDLVGDLNFNEDE